MTHGHTNKTIRPHEVSKDMRPLMWLSIRQGWRHERTANNHIKWLSPTGKVVFTGDAHGKTSDYRAIKNAKAELARAGLQLEEKKQVSTGCCPHGVSYTKLAKGEEICAACVDEKTPIKPTTVAAAVQSALPTAATTSLGDAIQAALHPEQTVLVAEPDLTLHEKTSSEASRPLQVRRVVEQVLSLHPTRTFTTAQIIMQAQGRLSCVKFEVSYALRMLQRHGKAINKRHGVWQWACVTELDLARTNLQLEAPLQETPVTASISAIVAPAPIQPATTGTLTTPKPATPPPGETTSEDMRKLDAALAALAEVEGIIRRTRDGLAHLEGLRKFLNGGGA